MDGGLERTSQLGAPGGSALTGGATMAYSGTQDAVAEVPAAATGGVRAPAVPHTANAPETPPRAQGPRYFRATWRVIQNGLMGADAVALFVAGLAGYALRFDIMTISPRDVMFITASVLMAVGVLQMCKAYAVETLKDSRAHVHAFFFGLISATAAILVCGFAVGFLKEASRMWLGFAAALGFVLIAGNHVFAGAAINRLRRRGFLRQRIAVVGATDRARMLLDRLDQRMNHDCDVVGVFDDRLSRVPETIGRHPVVGSTADLMAYLRREPVDRLILTLPWDADNRLREMLAEMCQVPVRIDLVPHDLVWTSQEPGLERLGGVPLVTIANCRVDEPMGLLKRLEDLVLGSLMLLALSPVMLATAIAIKLESRGPVLFRQKRYGFNNQVFHIYKFRSMFVEKVPDEKVKQATKDDPRITKVGRFIRRTSIDELPQIFNVLQGTMSVVGPRPHAVPHNELFGQVITNYFARHNVRPGITGWAQVNGLRGETDTDEKMRMRVEHDLEYIEKWTVLLDIKIVILTAVRVCFQKTAY